MKEIATAFVKAQKGFSPALKTNTNPHFKSKYADLSACVEAVIDALNANGIAMIQQTSECDNGIIVETVFIHESGEMLSSGKLHVPADKQTPQGYGSALTYARRYSLMAACGIAPEDDDGHAGSKQYSKPMTTSAPKVLLTESQVMDFLASIEASADETELKKNYVLAYKFAEAQADANACNRFTTAKDARKSTLGAK